MKKIYVIIFLIFIYIMNISDRVLASDFEYIGSWYFCKEDTNLIIPSKITLDNYGNILVSDPGALCIKKYNLKGSLVDKFGEFSGPTGIAVDSINNIYVLDFLDCEILKFKPSGELIKTWGSCGPKNNQLGAPTGIVIDSKNNIWIADKGNNRILKYDSKMNFILSIYGEKAGKFNNPIDIAIDKKNNIYVADMGNEQIQIYNNSGDFLYSFKLLDNPISITINEKKIYIGGMKSIIYEYTLKGKFINCFMCVGPLPNASKKIGYEGWPSSILVKGNQLIIMDMYYVRIMVFSIQ